MCELCARFENRNKLVETLRPARRPTTQTPPAPRKPAPPREDSLQMLLRLAATWAV